MEESRPPLEEKPVISASPVIEEERPQLPRLDYDGPIVTRKELWSYYLYFNGNNGTAPNIYSSTIFQTLATQAGWDSKLGPGNPCNAYSSATCVVRWGGGTKTISSLVLTSFGLMFSVSSVIFIVFGSLSDYGNIGRWLLLVLTIIYCTAQFASMSLVGPDDWQLAMGLFILSAVCFITTQMFFLSVFPRLGRNTAHTRACREKYERGELSFKEYEIEESMEKNRISNMLTVNRYTGCLIVLLLNLSLLIPLENHKLVRNYTIVLCNAYWVLVGIWWFIFQQPRPGPPVPGNPLTLGVRQIWTSIRQCRKLPNTYKYLIGQFLLTDGIATALSLIFIVQNDTFQLSFLMNTYLAIIQAVSWIIGTAGFWYVQRRWKLSTKKMFVVASSEILLVSLWGLIGIGTTRVGFHNQWEFWANTVITSMFQAPYFAFSQTAMGELSPPGYSGMFFGLYGTCGYAASIIGPNILSAIINRTHNNWHGFPLVFALCFCGCFIIWFFVDIQQGQRDAVAWAEDRRRLLDERSVQMSNNVRVSGDSEKEL